MLNVYKRIKLYFWLMERLCKECGQELIGRSDKRFCDDQCRSTFYNKQNRSAINSIRKINNILRSNRRILEQLNPNEKTVVGRQTLLDHGFSFTYFTNMYSTKSGKTYYFCYDYGYVELPEEKYGLVLKGDWVT